MPWKEAVNSEGRITKQRAEMAGFDIRYVELEFVFKCRNKRISGADSVAGTVLHLPLPVEQNLKLLTVVSQALGDLAPVHPLGHISDHPLPTRSPSA